MRDIYRYANLFCAEPYQPHSISPNWGGTLSQGPKIQSHHHLNTQRRFQHPKLKNEALEISEVGGPSKEKRLYITVTLGPFESKVFTHCNCFCGLLWKQSTLHITVAIWGPFESVVSLLTYYICYCGPLGKRRAYTLQLLLWSLWKQSTYTMQLLLGSLVKKSTCILQLLLGTSLKAE